MSRISTVIGLTLALAAMPSAAIAEPASKVSMGIATVTENNKMEVAEVRPGGTGDTMGVQPGDVITHIGDQRINPTKLAAFLRKLKVGDPVQLTVKRKGQTLQLKGTALARTS